MNRSRLVVSIRKKIYQKSASEMLTNPQVAVFLKKYFKVGYLPIML